jgi:aspartate racemase
MINLAKKYHLSSRSIGIIGGAGPMASCLLYRLIIEGCQKLYRSVDDSDFPKIHLLSHPFISMVTGNDAKSNRMELENQLAGCISTLEHQKCEQFAIACNTLHLFLPKRFTQSLRESHSPQMRVRRLDDSVRSALAQSKITRVLVLGTNATVSDGLYQNITDVVTYLTQDQQQQITEIIQAVLAGECNQAQSEALTSLIHDQYQKQRFEAVVLGCTELSVIQDRYPLQVKSVVTIDPLLLLADKLVQSLKVSSPPST